MSYHNQSIDELARTAEHENNALALEILTVSVDDDEDKIEQIIGDVADHFADQINENLTDYINNTYLNPESDYFDFLYEGGLEIDQDRVNDFDTKLTAKEITEKLEANLDYYCEIEINTNYAAPSGVVVASACIGEIEDSIEIFTDQIPNLFICDQETQEEFSKAVINGISTVTVTEKSELVYIDLSDSFASLVLKEDLIEELLSNSDED